MSALSLPPKTDLNGLISPSTLGACPHRVSYHKTTYAVLYTTHASPSILYSSDSKTLNKQQTFKSTIHTYTPIEVRGVANQNELLLILALNFCTLNVFSPCCSSIRSRYYLITLLIFSILTVLTAFCHRQYMY